MLNVRGRVLEPLPGMDRPVPGARIVINGSDPALTDANGSFTATVPVPSPDVTNFRVFLSFSKHGYVSQVEQVEISGPGTFELRDPIYVASATGTGSLEGRVVDRTTGRGIPDAQVTLSIQAGVAYSNRTGRDGSFLLSGIAAGESGIEVRLSARAADYLVVLNAETGETEKTVIVRKGSEKENSPVVLELLPMGFPSTIRGKVLNAEDLLPVANATVRISDKTAITDPAGSFTIVQAPTGMQNLRVDHQDFEPYVETLVVDGQPLTIFLNAPASFPQLPYTVSGTVILEGETNHSGVRVEARDKATGRVIDYDTSDPAGFYALWLPPGSYLVVATRDGFLMVQIEITLRAGIALSGVNFNLRRVRSPGKT